MATSEYNKQLRQHYKEHGICVCCGRNDAVPGKTCCADCAAKNVQRTRASQQKNRDRIAYNAYMKELRQKRKEQGLCQQCGKPTINGKVFCTEHNAVRRLRAERRRRKNDIMPRCLMGDGYHCYFCGATVAKVGDKCCPDCLERERQWSAEQRKKIDYNNAPWRKDNNIAFHKNK